MKTTKEAAKHYADGIVYQSINCTIELLKQLAEQDFKKGAEFAQHWIPIDEELPEESQDWHHERNQNYKYYDNVLCKSKNNKVFVARRYSFLNENIRWNVSSTSENSITHWRQIELK